MLIIENCALKKELTSLKKEYENYQKMQLHIDMSRGKPCKEQLDLSADIETSIIAKDDYICQDGTDCRNYGKIDGIEECKSIFAEILGVKNENIFLFGNSSLKIMCDLIANSYLFGVENGKPWKSQKKIKWLCPVPGYDRHFLMSERFGMEMICVPMNEHGPNMDIIESIVSADEEVKGIWCVPKYSTPSGITYDNFTVKRFARLKPKAKDFRIYWDNAYFVHSLESEKQDDLLNIISECEKAGNPDLVYEFCSTSKITYAGGGVSALISSKGNIESIKRQVAFSTLGYDKVNQMRHFLYFKNASGVYAQMHEHAKILRPKFELVEKIFSEELQGLATWTKPNGGYFILLSVPNIAYEVVSRARKCGVILSNAGSMFPYGFDPKNEFIRIAPSNLSGNELILACKILVLCIKIENFLKKISINT